MIHTILRTVFLAVFVVVGGGCVSAPKTAPPSQEDLISVAAAVELARGAFTAGCVRSHASRADKGHFADCRTAADSYIDDEVWGIIRAQPADRK